jgi:hypothetical protein
MVLPVRVCRPAPAPGPLLVPRLALPALLPELQLARRVPRCQPALAWQQTMTPASGSTQA